MAAWGAKPFGLDKVLSRGRQGDFDSLVSLWEKREKACRGKFHSSPFREELCPRGSDDTVCLPNTPRQAWCTDVHWDKLSSPLTQGWCWRQAKQRALSWAPGASHSYTRTQATPSARFNLKYFSIHTAEVPWDTSRGTLGQWGILLALPPKVSFMDTAYSHSVLYHRYTQR